MGMVQKGYEFREYYIPVRMMPGLERYRDHGVLPGQFLTAILENDFMEAAGRADDENLSNLPAYAGYLYNKMPRGSWGNKEIVAAWAKAKREAAGE